MKTNFRQDFPILNDEANPVVYLDSAATTQKPLSVIKSLENYYTSQNANPLRGLYKLSATATSEYEQARHSVAQFINANEDCEIIFTRNTTESLNLIAYTYGMENIQEGDEIVISILEHHSNILPWQMIAKLKKATLKYMYINDEGIISDEEIQTKITPKTKIVSITQVSNVLGVATPLKAIIKKAHEVGAIAIVDGAQGAPHMATDVQDLDCDFYAFSGHKMLAPMGIGALYGKKELLDKMPPFLSGGEMIEIVHWDRVKYAEVPHKFEAGTVNTGGAVGLHAAIEYINKVGFNTIMAQERKLTKIAVDAINDMKGVNLIGSSKAEDHEGIVTFTIDGVHPHDVASILDSQHIAVRAGHHCAQPLMDFLKVNSTTRASFAFYNTEEEVQHFIEELSKIRGLMGYGD